METLLESSIACPYCGEQITLMLDTSIPQQHYIEDCSVCCRPIELEVNLEGGVAQVTARTDSD